MAMHPRRRLFIGLAALILMGLPFTSGTVGAQATRAQAFERSEATVVTLRGRFRFSVEMAVTPAQRQLGLQGRAHLPADAGMLFDFGRDQPVSMWMLNTRIPLDMVFLSEAGRVVKVVENTQPFSLETVSSDVPVRAVLELNAGTAERIDLKPGSRVLHSMFGGS